MTDEKIELQALQLIEQTADIQLSRFIDIRCGTIESNGRLIPEEEYARLIPLLVPSDKPGTFVILTCPDAENCKRGNYPPKGRWSHGEGSPNEPHCSCYHNLKERHGDSMPECTRAYADQ